MTGDIDIAFRGDIGSFSLDASFKVPAAGITALFGPSGCGKTTILRCIAGLTHMPHGICKIDGAVWQDDASFLPTHRRPIGYVFQEASLFPHLSVRRNLLYGAPSGQALAITLDEVIDLLGLAKLLDRASHHLSGGERQRVAIGRALLSQPKLLLMDEPLSALDRATKHEILPFLENLHTRLRLPMLYVTHDIAEVERLADHLVLMQAGRVRAAGCLADLQADPALPLAQARDAAVSLDAIAIAYDITDGLAKFAVPGGQLTLPSPPIKLGVVYRLSILAGDISLALEVQPSTIINRLPARIVSATPLGSHQMLVVLTLGSTPEGARLLARVTTHSWRALKFADGQSVIAQIKGVALARGDAGHLHTVDQAS
jgi:molybdate transport system ATP-binding protein